MTQQTFVIRLTLPSGLNIDKTVSGPAGITELHYMETAVGRINNHVGFDALTVAKVQVS
jgi:hypothetical protein